MNSQAISLAGRKLIAYYDSKHFGGHEIQAAHAIRWMLQQGAEVTAFNNRSNPMYREMLRSLAEYGNLTLHTLEVPKIRYHRAYHLFNPEWCRELAKQFAATQAEAVFTIQGNLNISASGCLAARKAEIPSISYIALTHSFCQLGANRALRRDLLNRYLVHQPTRWLVVSESLKKRLKSKGARAPVDIIPNCIGLTLPATLEEARRRLNIPLEAMVIGMAGRLDQRQKGTDIFLEALCSLPPDHPIRQSWILLLGAGPQLKPIQERLRENGWEHRIVHQPWTSEPGNYYAAYDLLVMPSRFEGLPITMQEAILCDVPVAGSKVDGMGEFLPDSWTFSPDNPDALVSTLDLYTRDPDAYRQEMPTLVERIQKDHSRMAFEAVLADTFSRLLTEKDVAECD